MFAQQIPSFGPPQYINICQSESKASYIKDVITCVVLKEQSYSLST